MAYPIHGKICRVEKNSVLVENTEGWNIDVEVDTDEITPQGDNWKSFLAGCSGWSGGINLYMDPANTEQKAFMDNIIAAAPGTVLTDVEFNLEDSADNLSGDIIINGLGVATSVGGKVMMPIKFIGTGALSLTIA